MVSKFDILKQDQLENFNLSKENIMLMAQKENDAVRNLFASTDIDVSSPYITNLVNKNIDLRNQTIGYLTRDYQNKINSINTQEKDYFLDHLFSIGTLVGKTIFSILNPISQAEKQTEILRELNPEAPNVKPDFDIAKIFGTGVNIINQSVDLYRTQNYRYGRYNKGV